MKKLLVSTASLISASFLFAEMEPATPESQGVDSQGILDFIDAAERSFDGASEGPTKGHLHGFVIVRHGKVIAEGSWKPFDTLNETHMLYSHSKSFTSSAIGFLADEGKIDLDERIVDLFPEDVPENPDPRLGEIRVRDLLTMNVGADRDHTIGGNPADWTKWFMKKQLQRRPGTGFKYDSDATYMLAAIVEKKSGEKLMDYLKRKMFDRIGIKTAWTTTSPEGIACGGWGMNMTTRELARFGLLYLQNGTWEGKSVLSPLWCQLATARHTWSGWRNIGVKSLGEGGDWEQGYGFQFWRCTHGAYRADGAAGQYTVVLPEQDMVVSIHAGVNDMQKEINLIWDHLIPACRKEPLAENAAAEAALRDRLAKLEIKIPGFHREDGPRAYGDHGLERHAFEFKDNSRGFKSFSYQKGDNELYSCLLETRAGRQEFISGTFRSHCGLWFKGCSIEIDPESYEGLGAYVGKHKIAAACWHAADGAFRLRAYFTGDTGYLDLTEKDGKLTGEFWAMGGCKLESVDRNGK